MAKIIISCAVTGSAHTPSMSEALPITPEQIAHQSIDAAEAGAAIIHLHARDPDDGSPTGDPEAYARFLSVIKQRTDAIVNITTGGAVTMSVHERLAAALRFRPEMCSLNIESLNFAFFQAADRITSNALWCSAPYGLTVEIAVAPKCSPDAKSSFDPSARFHEHRGAGPRSRNAVVRPRRLAHIALYTGGVHEAMGFYGERLGLRLSDRSGDDVAFMHGPYGSDHHLIALARLDGPGMHHCSWDVATVAEVGQGAMQMEAAGYTRGWGLGRHVLGSNYFHYVRDPWGSYSEYSADMDFIPATMDWPGADHPGEDSFYQWGTPPPEDFVRNYETVPA